MCNKLLLHTLSDNHKTVFHLALGQSCRPDVWYFIHTFMPLKSHSRIIFLSFQTNATGDIWDLKYQLQWKLDWRTWVLIYCDITAVVKSIVLHIVEDYVFHSGSVKENKYCHHFFTVRKLTGHDKQFSKFKFFVTFMRCVIYETACW